MGIDDSFFKKSVGKRVRDLRLSMGLSKVAFAKLIGISSQYLGRVEDGVTMLTIMKVVNICEVADVSLDFLIYGRDLRTSFSKFEREFANISIEQIEAASDIVIQMRKFLKVIDANGSSLKLCDCDDE